MKPKYDTIDGLLNPRPPIANPLQRLALKVILSALNGLRKLKHGLGLLLRWLTNPFRMIGRFLFSVLLVPGFHVVLTIRRQLDRLYLPAKNKLLFLFSNRFAIHFAIVVISIFSVFGNIRPTEVQAEEYGQESVIYALLGEGGPDVIEEVTAESSSFVPQPTSYRGAVALSTPVAQEPDTRFIGSEATSSTSLSAPTTSQTATAVAKRDDTTTYTVTEGDTVSTIAQKFGLSITTVLWANDLSVRSTIRPGDSLTILPVDGVVHKVTRGDTLSKISKLYGADTDKIQAANKLASVNDLSIGELLLIPGGERQAPAKSRRVASVSNLFSPTQTPPNVSGGKNAIGMIWPTDLHKINTYFGQYYVYGRHWGLDIDCNYNNNNYAAADGIVTRAGWNGAYGNLVEINHGNGIVTRYGHNAKIYVKVGQTVSQGDPVGLCGTTGRSTGTHLHFEVRINNQPVNPLDYL